jgi:hypothetical protein
LLLLNKPVKAMKELQKVTAKLTAIVRDTPLSRAINQDTEKERNAASGRGRPLGATGEGG